MFFSFSFFFPDVCQVDCSNRYLLHDSHSHLISPRYYPWIVRLLPILLLPWLVHWLLPRWIRYSLKATNELYELDGLAFNLISVMAWSGQLGWNDQYWSRRFSCKGKWNPFNNFDLNNNLSVRFMESSCVEYTYHFYEQYFVPMYGYGPRDSGTQGRFFKRSTLGITNDLIDGSQPLGLK